MKVRTIALGLVLEYEDFIIGTSSSNKEVSVILIEKFEYAKVILDKTMVELERLDYIVQTQRIFLNSFEDWLLPLLENPYNLTIESIIQQLIHCLERTSIQFCTIGNCSTVKSINLIPKILSMSDRLSSSILFTKTSSNLIAPDRELCILAAKTCLEIANNLGNLGNFRFCASFNCPPGIPFFPAAYHRDIEKVCNNNSNSKHYYQDTISLSIGLESGDLLFLAFHGADNHIEGRDNLADIMRQALQPIQKCAEVICKEFNIKYCGIDASINPGLSLPDSIGAGIESLLYNCNQSEEYAYFGSMGTLAVVSAITSAIKSLANPKPLTTVNNDPESSTHSTDIIIKLAGYSGLMLPVMEDLILAQRAAEGKFFLRDLLMFSSLCGVGLDTVPIPGNTSIDVLAGIYMEVAAVAFRLDKPLSCRLLPMKDKIAGDLTEIQSPYLCNTIVFKVP